MMKSKVLMATGLSAMLLLAGCGSKESSKGYSEYVTELGEYKGVEVTLQSTEVTSDEVQSAIDAELSSKAEDKDVTDRAVKDGDIVNIDYVGKIDGEEFDGGSAKGSDLTIGSGQFIDGFEDQLIGANIGDTVTVNVTFPDDYQNADVAGKDAEFTVTINSIKVSEVPELTDEWVAANFDDYKTVKEYKKAKKAELVAQKEEEAETAKKADVLTTIVDSSTISGYPQDEIDEYVDNMKSYYESYASYMGTDFATLLEQGFGGMTEDEFQEQATELGKQTIAREMVCSVIAEKEGITVSDEEYQAGLEKYTSDYNYETTDAFLEDYSEEVVKKNLVFEKVLDFISEQAVVVDATEDTTANE